MKIFATQRYRKGMKFRQIVETGFGMMKGGGNVVSSYAMPMTSIENNL